MRRERRGMLVGVAVVLAALWSSVADTPGARAYAPAPVTLSQLLDLNQRAAGALQPGAYRAITRTQSSDGDVWASETFSDGSDFRTTVKQGDVSWAYGEYQGRQWHQDANGLVLPATSFFQEEDPFVGALRAPENLQNGVRLLGLSADASPSLVVELAPRSGLIERRYYDARTDLLSRLEMTDYDGHKQVWLYSDYRRLYGMEVAGIIDYEQDGTSVTRRTSIMSYDRVPAAAADVTIPPSRPLFDLGGRDAVVIPAQFTEHGIIVRVSIAGRGLDFQLDSGSSDMIIDRGVADELGMKSTGAVRMSYAGDFMMANARASDLSVAGLAARDVAFSTVAFEEEHPGERTVGLLGTDFIASGALEVDFDSDTLTLHRQAPPDLAQRGWSALPLRLDYGVPMIQAAFSGVPGNFVADLGADYSTLYPHYFAQFPNHIPQHMADQDEMVTLGGKPFGIKYLTMKRLVLGDWIFGDVQVAVPSAVYAQERDYDGLIGRNTLSSFNLIFDYSNHKLWFKPLS
jgi:Aspartyl protease